MYDDEIMETSFQKNGAPCRDWKETFIDVMLLVALVLFGIAIGIGMCKFWPEFWWFVNWGCAM